jgi:hypothetical protein
MLSFFIFKNLSGVEKVGVDRGWDYAETKNLGRGKPKGEVSRGTEREEERVVVGVGEGEELIPESLVFGVVLGDDEVWAEAEEVLGRDRDGGLGDNLGEKGEGRVEGFGTGLEEDHGGLLVVVESEADVGEEGLVAEGDLDVCGELLHYDNSVMVISSEMVRVSPRRNRW